MAHPNSKLWWNSVTPGYIIFLIDQSSLMSMPFYTKETKAEAATEIVNKTIYELINANMDGSSPKDRVFISIIGYGGQGSNSVNHIQSDFLSAFANNPLRIKKTKQQMDDGNGAFIEVSVDIPIFIEPHAEGNASMGRALAFAKDLIEKWIFKKPNNPLPIILNISAGIPFDETYEEPQKTIKLAAEIMNIKVDGFSPTIFNIYLGDTSEIKMFPDFISNNEYGANLLFKISSELPNYYKKIPEDCYASYFKSNAKAFTSNIGLIQRMIYFGKYGISQGEMIKSNFGENIIFTP